MNGRNKQVMSLYCRFLELGHLEEYLLMLRTKADNLFLYKQDSDVQASHGQWLYLNQIFTPFRKLQLSDSLFLIQKFEHFKWFHVDVTRKSFLRYIFTLRYHFIETIKYKGQCL